MEKDTKNHWTGMLNDNDEVLFDIEESSYEIISKSQVDADKPLRSKSQSKSDKKESANLSKIELSEEPTQLFKRPVPNGELRVVWYIKDIKQYWENPEIYTKLKSEEITTPDNWKWNLYLFPNGERQWKGYVSIFVKAQIPNHDIEKNI